MFKLLIILWVSFTIFGCSKSTDDIVSTINYNSNYIEDLKLQINSSIQEYFDNDEEIKGYHLHVEDLTLMESGKNQYKGWVKINYNGVVHDVSLDVLYDGSNMHWEIPSGQMMSIVQQSIKEDLKAIDEELKTDLKEIDEKLKTDINELNNEIDEFDNDFLDEKSESDYIEEQVIRE